jgi:YEATS domain-containing protein 4
VTETGWGEFTVQIRLQFVQESGEKPMNLAHPIKLHHWGAPLEGLPQIAPSTTVTAAPTTAAPTPTETAGSTTATEVKEEQLDKEKRDADGDVSMGSSSEQPLNPKEGTAETGEADAEGEAEETISAERPDTVAQPPAQSSGPLSIAAKFPVHAWQYDELVFTDPPLVFYNILNEHPPTPMPARNRRPRDQREIHNKKTKKGRVSTIAASAASSRQGTPAGEGGIPPGANVPGPGAQIGVGIPGEPGSADVPLEFTLEMEKAEWNKMREAKRKIIEETDRWRCVQL